MNRKKVALCRCGGKVVEYHRELVYASRGVLAGLVGISAGTSVLEP
jgi:ammonia channel protein AmtB